MLRRLSDRARVEGMRALRQALDSIRTRGGHLPGGDLHLVRASLSNRPDADESIQWRRTETERDEVTPQDAAQNTAFDEPTPVHLAERDAELTKGLDRIADTIERLAVQLDSYHHELAEHLDTIEFLLREIVINTVPASAARPIVLGGVIDPEAIDLTGPEITIIADGYPLEVDTPVEVRSRFHDRWICGFAIADAVEGPGGCRYRLTRRSDGIPLPILFDKKKKEPRKKKPKANSGTSWNTTRRRAGSSRLRSCGAARLRRASQAQGLGAHYGHVMHRGMVRGC